MVAGRHVQQERRVGHRAGQWSDAGQTVEWVGVGPGGDAAPLGLDPDQVGPGRRDAHRAQPVRAERRGDQSGGDCRGRATGGTAGRVLQAPRVAGDPERGALGDRPLPQLGSVGLAHDHRAGLLEPAHHLAVLRLGLEAARAAELGRLTGQVGVVLDGHRDPEQRRSLPGGQAAVGPAGLVARRLSPQAAERVQRGLRGLDPLQGQRHQLLGGNLAAGQQLGLAVQPGERQLFAAGDGGAHSARWTSLAALSPERTAPSM